MHLYDLYRYVKLNNFENLTVDQIKKNKYLKEHKIFFNELKKNLKRYSFFNAIQCLIQSYENDLDTFEKLKEFINIRLIDKENEVSPSILFFLIKMNPLIKEKILFHTIDYPQKMTLVGRCELIRKDIRTFPVCIHCKINKVAWHNSSNLALHCCTKCANASNYTKEKRSNTNLERFGSDCYLNSEIGKKQIKNTMIERYGVDNFLKRGVHYEKIRNIMIEKYGVDNNWKSKENREQIKSTMLERYGVEYYTLAKDFQEKANKTKSERKYIVKQTYFVKTKEYKNSGIFYQGTYELYFLDLMESKNLIHLVKRGQSLYYEYENEKCLYYPDFSVNGILIEIKSKWTYNKYGRDLEMQKRNEAKWAGAKNAGFEITILMDKKEIKNYVDLLNNTQ